MLRAYAKYMRQGQTPFALDYIEEALASNVKIARLLVELFEARFDPALGWSDDQRRTSAATDLDARLHAALDDVASLDQDRILRSYLTHVNATLRTSYFQSDESGHPRPYIAFKLEPSAIPELPEPRPRFEIFVYSPRVEGVHLRFGPVARGGLRWSDRRDDFRTEILGLVKAQMVKNTVIVPVGAKGGFFAKQLPDPVTGTRGWRRGWRATARSSPGCSTSPTTSSRARPCRRRVVRHDSDDVYLVVAADKGTATLLRHRQRIAKRLRLLARRRLRLRRLGRLRPQGDGHHRPGRLGLGAAALPRARASTARREDFTCVGVGDMSGDVFGNGMLCSEHTRLVAAFDHRHIFIDPDPDPAASYAERRRLFELPRSSWADYDTDSDLRGRRGLRALAEGDQDQRRDARGAGPRRRRGEDDPRGADARDPRGTGRPALERRDRHLREGLLRVARRRRRQGQRLDPRRRPRAPRAVRGEGGNLGLTQAGRIEYALRGCDGDGGRINTDFIDNSAGVDTSDHEVNIKILLDRVVAAGDLTEKQRNETLAAMTDEVAALVLRDNFEQNLALANAAAHAPSLLHVHESWIKQLERDGVLDRELEGLPSRREIRRRLERREGLNNPELAVMMAWTKIVLAQELLTSDLPDDPYFEARAVAYFPRGSRRVPLAGARPPAASRDHRHPGGQRAGQRRRDDLLATPGVGDRRGGARPGARQRRGTGHLRLRRPPRRGRRPRQRARRLGAAPDAHRDAHPGRARLAVAGLQPASAAGHPGHRRCLRRLGAAGADRAAGADHRRRARRVRGAPRLLVAAGADEDLAARVAVMPPAYQLLNVIEVAARVGLDAAEVARVHFTLAERLGLPALVHRILALPRRDQWETMARAALRDDLHAVHAELTAQVLGRPRPTTARRPASRRGRSPRSP